MKVNVQVGGRATALNQSDRTAVSLVGPFDISPGLTEQVARDDEVHHRCCPWPLAIRLSLTAMDGRMHSAGSAHDRLPLALRHAVISAGATRATESIRPS